MTSILLGLLGAALGAGFFIAGFMFGRRSAVPAERTVREYVPSEDETAEIEKERERLKEDQAAFHQMMGYSADVAYGRKKMPGKE